MRRQVGHATSATAGCVLITVMGAPVLAMIVTGAVAGGGAGAREGPMIASVRALPNARATCPAARDATLAAVTAAADAKEMVACPAGLQQEEVNKAGGRGCAARRCRALGLPHLLAHASMPRTAETTRRHSGERTSASRVAMRVAAMSSALEDRVGEGSVRVRFREKKL